jgi:NAD(P)-dependent dehydrogenase (short-subunit alcohol dehydrogenase family)
VEIANGTFLITGGGSGLGAATARLLAESGARVLVADVDEVVGENTASGIGNVAHSVYADVTDEESVQNALDAALDAFGSLSGVVNCAGVGSAERVLGRNGPHPLDAFVRTVQINLIGTFNVVRLGAAVMAQNEPTTDGERGVIVNTASVAAFDGQIGQVAYSASKAGVAGMTLPVARELAQHGIRVMTIAPGIFDTPMLAALLEEARESLSKQVPFPPRLGRPGEYVALVKHIIENEMLNGEIIRLDGSMRMAAR